MRRCSSSFGPGDEHLVGDLLDQLADAGAHDIGRTVRGVHVDGVPLLQLAGQLDLGGVDVRDGEGPQLAVLQHLHRAPVGQRRHASRATLARVTS